MLFAWQPQNRSWTTGSAESVRQWFEDQVGPATYYAAPLLTLAPLALSEPLPFGVLPPDPAQGPRHTRDTLQAALVAHSAAHPSSTDPAWCAHLGLLPARVVHAPGVAYMAVIKVPYLCSGPRGYSDYREVAMLTPDGENVEQWDCAHCARLAGEARASTHPPVGSLEAEVLVLMLMPGYSNLTGYLPPAPETTGEARLPGSATSKNVTLDDLPSSTCGQCGRPGHNIRTCEHPAKAHDKIGIEIEGRWLDLRAARTLGASLGMSNCGDGSVHGSSDSAASPHEFQTDPGSMLKAIDQLVKLYPDEVDHSCGMHVHLSFLNPLDLTLLCTPEFFAHFKARWTAWGDANRIYGKDNGRGEFWKRLNGDNDYCRVNTQTPRGDITRMDRYHQLNFSAWQEHKTVECRLLPMFRKASLAVSAVKELVAIFEDFLADPAAHGLPDMGETITLPAPEVAPYVTTHYIEEASLVPWQRDLVLDLPAIEPLSPASGAIRTFRGTVLGGATLAHILRANNINISEAS